MQLKSQGSVLNLSAPQVMGILNITPDSFSDGGTYLNLDAALRHAQTMVEAGAAIIDVGGESTRPGAMVVSDDEQLTRVIPVIEGLVRYFDVWISIDTSKPLVMQEAVAAGAHLVNDVRALSELGAFETVAKCGVPVCLMHMKGQPHSMQQSPQYENLLVEISDFFKQRIEKCLEAGILKQNLVLDPGFGFGKSLQHNYQLLSHLSQLCHFGVPLLVGISRKSMIGQLLNVSPDKRLAGSIAGAVMAVMQGARIIRAHDVKETVEAMRIVEAVLLAKGSNEL